MSECATCGETEDLRPLDPRSGYHDLACEACRQRYEDGPDE